MAMATGIILVAIYSALLGRFFVLPQSILHFQEEPRSTDVYDGQILTLNCVVQSGWTTGVIHWMKDEVTEISRGSIIQSHRVVHASRFSIVGERSQGNNNLQIKNARPSDAGSYVCHLYDLQGSHIAETAASTVTVLPVQPPPSGYPVCPLSIPNPKPGDTIIFRCYSIGEHPAATLRFWRGPHEELQVEPYMGLYGGVFFERQLNEDDNNITFTCMATGPAFKLEHHRNCSVVPFVIPTSVNVIPAIAEVPTGMAATFQCKTVAVPQANKFRWWIWNNGWDRILATQGRYVLEGDGESMRILDINEYDDGRKVRCIARNPLGLKGEAEGKLKVYVVRPTARGPNWSGGRPGDNNKLYNSTNPTESYNDDGFKIGASPNVVLIVCCVVAGFFGVIIIVCIVVILLRRDSRDKHELKEKQVSAKPPTQSFVNKKELSTSDVVDKALTKLGGYATIDTVSNTDAHLTASQNRAATLDSKPLYAKPIVRTDVKQKIITETKSEQTSHNFTHEADKHKFTENNVLNSGAILAMYAKPMKGKIDNSLIDCRPVPSPRKNSGKSGRPTSPLKPPRPKSDNLHSKPKTYKSRVYENTLDRNELSSIEETNLGQKSLFEKNVEGLVYAELNLQQSPQHLVRSMEVRPTEYAKIKN
ncbi:uncharacterized protein LOC117108283 [Anneissia japonica]|uniref:uncharacterized protein LOC117108283 n=1 Tax=Anneissia japonica TaxID=1529436 RepID=UPI001425B969|nr:uncharacterized protein LOC117108283 [Anneissia japonica]